MILKSKKINSRYGDNIFVRSWKPEKYDKVIIIVHGLGEHSGRYKIFEEFLKNHKVAIYALDLPGHGMSDGKKGDIKKFDRFLDYLEDVLIHVRKKNLETPITLFGHSLGGLICLSFLINRESKEIHSAIISSPWIKLGLEVPKYLIGIQKVLVNIIPSFRLSNRININDLTKDNDINYKYSKDQLVHDRISFRLYSEINKQIDLVKERANRIKIKTLLYHGSDDKIISSESVDILSLLINNNQKIIFDKAYHEPHNDLEKKEVFKKIIKFLN